MKYQNVEKPAYVLAGLAALLYGIGWIFDLDIIYNWLGIPVLIAGLSWVCLQMSTTEAQGRVVLKFLLWATLAMLALLFIGGACVAFYMAIN